MWGSLGSLHFLRHFLTFPGWHVHTCETLLCSLSCGLLHFEQYLWSEKLRTKFYVSKMFLNLRGSVRPTRLNSPRSGCVDIQGGKTLLLDYESAADEGKPQWKWSCELKISTDGFLRCFYTDRWVSAERVSARRQSSTIHSKRSPGTGRSYLRTGPVKRKWK